MKKKLSITQKEVVEFALDALLKYKQTFIDLEMGFGKTLTALAIVKKVIGKDYDFRRVLYICPVSLIPQVEKVFKENLPSLKIDFKSFGWFQDFNFLKTQMSNSKLYDLVIIDEAHKIKSYSSSILCQAEKTLEYFIDLKNYDKKQFPYTLVSIGVLKFISGIKYRVFMSGTAMPLGAVDLFNFLWLAKHPKTISNVRSRQESFLEFCEMFCNKKKSPMGVSYSGFKKKTYPIFLEKISDIYLRKEHVDEKSLDLKIPDPVYHPIEIQDKEKSYTEEERIIEILRKQYNVDSSNFLQILKTTPQFAQVMTLRRAVGLSKIDGILEHTKRVGKKAIYFFQFRESAQIFYNTISKKYKNVFLVTGHLSIKKTSKLVELANDLDECLLIATMGKAGTGFDCYGFNTIAFCELDVNFAIVEQAAGRILRKGIKHVPNIYFFITPGGVDEMVIENLLGKQFKRLATYEKLKESRK